jgi:hypothetical protein
MVVPSLTKEYTRGTRAAATFPQRLRRFGEKSRTPPATPFLNQINRFVVKNATFRATFRAVRGCKESPKSPAHRVPATQGAVAITGRARSGMIAAPS